MDRGTEQRAGMPTSMVSGCRRLLRSASLWGSQVVIAEVAGTLACDADRCDKIRPVPHALFVQHAHKPIINDDKTELSTCLFSLNFNIPPCPLTIYTYNGVLASPRPPFKSIHNQIDYLIHQCTPSTRSASRNLYHKKCCDSVRIAKTIIIMDDLMITVR